MNFCREMGAPMSDTKSCESYYVKMRKIDQSDRLKTENVAVYCSRKFNSLDDSSKEEWKNKFDKVAIGIR